MFPKGIFKFLLFTSLALFSLIGSGCEKNGGKEVNNEDLEAFLSERPSSNRPQVSEEPFVPPKTVDPYRVDEHTGGAIEPTRELPDISSALAGGGDRSERPETAQGGPVNEGEGEGSQGEKQGFLKKIQSLFVSQAQGAEPEVDEEDVPNISGLEIHGGDETPDVEPSTQEPPEPAASPTYQLDFTQNFSKSADDVLDEMGFEVPSIFISDIEPRFAGGSLLIGKFNKGFYGLRKKEITEIPAEKKRAIKKMNLSWGVAKYPSGENWDNSKKRRNSVGVIVSFGGKTSAGVPYFLGFVLTKTAKPFQYFRPSRYGDVGRYVTLSNPPERVFLDSKVDLKKHFHAAFGSDVPYPGVSGIGLEVDTRGMSGVGGIKKIQFFE